MVNLTRRQVTQAIGAAALGCAPGLRAAPAGSKPDIVVAAAQPVTGVFSTPGSYLNAGLGDFVAWRNSQGGVLGHKLRYVWEDSSFKVDQSATIFKKLMASDKPSFFYLDNTGAARAVAQDAIASGTVMTSSPSLAGLLADPAAMPHHFIAGPTYGAMHEVLMEYIARSSQGSAKPNVALVYTESEFGRDGIPASKARAQKLGIPVVAEVVTKVTGMDVSAEVARLRRAKADIVVFQGYVVTPIPEFVRQMREAGMNSQVMGTIWSSDQPLLDALAAMNESYMGVVPYRYAYDTESSTMKTIRDYVAKTRPTMSFVSHFYVNAWLAGMVFAEVAERCIRAGKPLTLPNMKRALESMKDWDTGGVTGLLADLSRHQIASGRLYRLDVPSRKMEPASGWIRA
ncbi:MAG: transporter substrate-binding protein [Ramlibacter sp.]|nr:transporter substrate-binding protein [Ramlibacter sp.]